MALIKELSTRVSSILATGASLDTVARKVNAEFQATAYVNRGKLWGRFKDESGNPQVRVLA